MHQRRLGSTGLMVSDVALGTMTWGRDTDEHEAREQFEVYLDAGGVFVDTADVYADGAAQEILGHLLHDHRDDDIVVLSRSGGSRNAARPFELSRRHLMHSLESTLRRLGVDAVDIWSIHGPDDGTHVDETCAAMSDALQSGKALYTSVCDWSPANLGYATGRGCAVSGGAPTVAQYEYSLLQRGVEDDVVPFLTSHGLGLVAWSPLGRGVLTGKYRRGTPADSRGATSHLRAFVEPYLDLRSRQIVDAMCAAAEGLAVAPLDIALAWVLARPAVSSAIVGARTAAQLRGILAGHGLELPAEIVRALDDVSHQPTSYPSSTAW